MARHDAVGARFIGDEGRGGTIRGGRAHYNTLMAATFTRPRHRYRFRLTGLLYLGIAAFIGVAAVNSQTNLLFFTFALMVGVVVVSILGGGVMARGLHIEREAPDQGAVDEPLAVRYTVTNRRRWVPAFGLMVREVGPVALEAAGAAQSLGWAMHVGPRQQVGIDVVWRPCRRGVVELDRIEMATHFPFGILRKAVVWRQPARLVIYPRVHTIPPRWLEQWTGRERDGRRRGDRAGGHEEFHGVRDYRPGDTGRQIDWKRSAHSARLVSRVHSRPQSARLVILLDLRGASEQRDDQAAERAISLAASVVCAAGAMRVQVGLMVRGAACSAGDLPADRHVPAALLEALASIDTAAPSAADSAGAIDPSACCLVIHAGRIDEAFGPPGAAHLSGDDIEQYIVERVATSPPATAEAAITASPEAAA